MALPAFPANPMARWAMYDMPIMNQQDIMKYVNRIKEMNDANGNPHSDLTLARWLKGAIGRYGNVEDTNLKLLINFLRQRNDTDEQEIPGEFADIDALQENAMQLDGGKKRRRKTRKAKKSKRKTHKSRK